MARICTITANPLLDYVGTGSIRDGVVNRVPDLSAEAEGKGVNVARVLTALGHEVIATGFAGGHSGRHFTSLVEAIGVETSFVATMAELRVGFLLNDGAGPTTVLGNGFAVSGDEAAALGAKLDSILSRDPDLVIISGSVPDPSLEMLYADLLRRCAAQGVTCWVDSYGPVMEAALACPTPPAFCKPNDQEWSSSDNWQRATEVHLSRGAGLVQVQAPEATYRLTPPVINERNPIGSGDCYLAAYAASSFMDMTRPERLRWACAAGAANAARDDVAMIGADDITALVDQVHCEEVTSR